MIYLDNSATTEPDTSVMNSFQQVSERFFANSSSIHQLGGESEKLLSEARNQVAQLLHVKQGEIVFTSGGTEGNNMAIKGIALEHQGRGKHIITTSIEHPSVFEACKSLEKLGFEVTYLPVDQYGVLSVEELERSIRPDTILISVMHVNNELGSIQPIKEIAEIAEQHPKLFFHVDDVQGIGKLPLDLSAFSIDLCTFSGHKIHGIKGTGILYIKDSTTIYPLFHGGNQEGSYRSGTENVAGAVAIAKALRFIKMREKEEIAHLQHVHHYLRTNLAQMSGVIINTPEVAAPHIMNVSVPGLRPEVMIHLLAEKGIYISTKSACSSRERDESRILTACGFKKERSTSALRISMNYDNTVDEMKVFLRELEEAIKQLTKVMR